MFQPYRAGDYFFTVKGPTGLGDIEIAITDTLGTDCGNFYINDDDTEDDFRESCDAWLKEQENPDGGH